MGATAANRRLGGTTTFRAARLIKHGVSGGGSLHLRLPSAEVLIKGLGMLKHKILTRVKNGKRNFG
jgi:hypothetical protein